MNYRPTAVHLDSAEYFSSFQLIVVALWSETLMSHRCHRARFPAAAEIIFYDAASEIQP